MVYAAWKEKTNEGQAHIPRGGNLMQEFITGDITEIINNPENIPTTSFVIVESKRGYMLLYNKYRKVWELTGGMIETGETPEECAIRECKEESNQVISNLKFIGLAKYEKMNAAIYSAFLNEEESFTENSEISFLRWWNSGEKDDNLDFYSMEILKIYNPTLSIS